MANPLMDIRSAGVVLLVLALHAVPSGPLPAQQGGPDSTLLGNDLAPFLALSVADLQREIAWYRDTLGFSIYAQGPLTERIDYALLREGSALVELLHVRGSYPRNQAAPGATDPSQVRGFFKGGIVVGDIDRLYRLLQDRRVHFLFPLGRPPHGPYRAFGIADPEGNVLQFFGV